MLCKNKGYCSIVINFQHPKCTACSINDVLQELSLCSSIVIREIAAGIHYAGVSKQLLILLQKAIKQYWINGSICYGQPINAHGSQHKQKMTNIAHMPPAKFFNVDKTTLSWRLFRVPSSSTVRTVLVVSTTAIRKFQ
ncbi:hypothetical protein OUZ56_013394 [Daphnia magna]|uniref:Uncharacterized protein n=1 Tax=Daphnia magna TaxID=35525 RepID=A0ABQ9Z5U6_9CRUS|nr:hypothetical protein OUZ56_013394 [Daphnia magna]